MGEYPDTDTSRLDLAVFIIMIILNIGQLDRDTLM